MDHPAGSGLPETPGPVSPKGIFATTHWTVVLEAARPDSESGSAAFGRLYSDYWYPLYAHLRRRGRSQEQAEDLLQDFFCRLLSKQALEGLERDGGRFRSFLLRSLENFLANEWDRASAQKRGGGVAPLALDSGDSEERYAIEPADTATPEAMFERRWVVTLLGRVMDQLAAEMGTGARAALFADLRPHLAGERGGAGYAEIATRHGMSEGAIKVTIHRWRHRYAELLREEVARTVSNPDEVETELRHLIAVVTG